MDLSVLIVSYNTRELTLACLRSLYAETHGLGFEVIVADNASSDGSAPAIAAEFPTVRLIARQDNLGFARANNLAAEHATGEYLLLLNPDTVVLDGAVRKLVAFARSRPGAGIWGGRTLFADRSLNPTSCWARPTPWSMFCLGTGLASVFRRSRLFDPESLGPWARDTVREVDIVTGCFLLISAERWRELRGFDPVFFMYGEEADLCLRARELGCRPAISPEATIIHYGGASEHVRADKMARLLSAKATLIRRHWPPASRWFGLSMLWAWGATRAAATGCLATFAPRRFSPHAEVWRTVWRRRSEWLPGYDAARPRAGS